MPVDLTGVDLATETVRTPRLLLRPFRDDDVADIVLACNDPLIARWLAAIPAPYAEPDAREFLAGIAVHERAEGTGLTCAMQEIPTGRLVGSVGLSGLTRETGSVLGYWVAPWGRGRGYAAEATEALARWAFAHGVHRVWLVAAVGNLASCRTAERAGFRREGVLRESHRDRAGVPKDMVLYARLPTDPAPEPGLHARTGVGVRELRQRASQLLRLVEAGETIEITDRGRPVAVLSPLPSAVLARLRSDER